VPPRARRTITDSEHAKAEIFTSVEERQSNPASPTELEERFADLD
jgi:hypothetical protein